MAAQPVPALFEPSGDGFRAAPMTRGPWDTAMMHGGAPSALLAHEIEQLEPGAELAVARLTIEFLAGVPVGDVSVRASLAKPGRRLQIVDATLAAGDRPACLARAVRLRVADLPQARAAAAGAVAAMAPVEDCEPQRPFSQTGDEMSIPTRPRSGARAERPAAAPAPPGSACAASCCRAWRHRRSCGPWRRRTSPTA